MTYARLLADIRGCATHKHIEIISCIPAFHGIYLSPFICEHTAKTKNKRVQLNPLIQPELKALIVT
jgi:hypothetical protein